MGVVSNPFTTCFAGLKPHSSVSRVGQVLGDIRPVFMLPTSHDVGSKRHQLKIKFLTSFNDFPSPNYSCILNMPMSWEEGWHLLMHARGSRDIKCVTNAMVLFK